MKIQINDCTIRDGGYLTNKNSSPEFVQGVIKGLVASGIDCIELGFLQDETKGESLVYANTSEAKRFIPVERKSTIFAGFADNSRFSIRNLDAFEKESFDVFRLSFAKHEAKEALNFAEAAKAKGYKVFVQPMDAPGYSSDERKSIIEQVNKIKPYCFSIVDTFGAMYLSDLQMIYGEVEQELDKEIRIGLHSHNNLQLSNALAEVFIDLAVASDRDIVVDGSLYGMGRGAGNASLEIIASYINNKYHGNYDMGIIFDTIDKYILPIRTKVMWGYDLPMFICGEESAHVDNICYLQKKGCNVKEMYHVLRNMDIEKRKRYGRNYSKSDFSDLEEAYEKNQREERNEK